MERVGGIELDIDQQDKNNSTVFIVLEGLDGIGKSTTAEQLVGVLGAESFHTPDNRLQEVRRIFDSCSMNTRTAFYVASNLLASDQIRERLRQKSIVLDRYYGSTFAAAYSHKLFPASDLNFKAEVFSANLVKPDVTILLKLDEEVRQERIKKRGKSLNRDELNLLRNSDFRQRYTEALELVSDVSIDITGKSPEEITDIIVGKISKKPY